MAHAGTKEALWTRPFALTLLGILFMFTPFALYLPVLPVYLLQELHSSLKAAGAVNGIFLVAAVLFRAHTARLEARFGNRRVLLVSGCLFMATSALFLAATTVTGVMLIRFFSGACFAVVSNGIYSMGSRLIPASRKGEGLALLTTMALAGYAIGPYIGLNLSSALGYRAVFVASALISLLGMLVFSMIGTPDEEAPVQAPFSFAGLYEVKAIPVSLIAFVLTFAYGGVLTFVAVYAGELRLTRVVEYFFVAMAAASIGARLATGRMYDRFGPNATIYPAILLIAAGLLTLGYMPTTAGMLSAAALIGVGHGMAVPGIQTLALQLSPAHRTSAATATFFTCMDGGLAVGAYLLGGTIDAFGYALVYKSLGVMSLACMLFYWAVYAGMRKSAGAAVSESAAR